MRILHICSGIPLSAQGGVTNYVRALSFEQAKNDNQVYILNAEKNDGFNVIEYSTSINIGDFRKKNDQDSLKHLKEIIESYDFDIIHIHMCLNMDWDFYKVLEGRKYVVSLHDYFYICPRIQLTKPGCYGCRGTSTKCKNCFSLLERNTFLRRAFRKLFGDGRVACSFPLKDNRLWNNWIAHYKPLLENSSCLLPVSNRVKEIYENAGITGNYRVVHIGNITAKTFKNIIKPNTNRKIKLVILSQFSTVKGGRLICSLIKKCSNSNLEFHFYGKTNSRENQLMNSCGIINHGPYKQIDLPKILDEMDMGIVAPIWEDNAPQVVMEMINNGLPVFGTRMGGIPDFVDDSNGFLFDPFDDKELFNASSFLNNLSFDKIHEMQRRIHRTNTPSEHSDELLELYKALLA